MRNVVLRELDRIAHSPLLIGLMLVFPAATLVLLWAIFSAGVPRDLPVAVVDHDGSNLSRRLVRMIDANPTLRVVPASTNEAEGAVLAGRAYGVVTIPRDFGSDLLRGRSVTVTGHYNAQVLVVGSLVRRALSTTVSTFSAGVEMRQRRGRGDSGAAAAERFEPIRMDLHTLANPELSYVTFLMPALFATMLQVFGVVTAVWAFGIELRAGTARQWLDAADDSTARAMLGKFAVYAGWFALVGTGSMIALYDWLAIPVSGSRFALLANAVLFTTASVSVGMLFVALTSNLRFACSVTAFFTGPAFAFTGISFPVQGMPAIAQWWSSVLPVTHSLRAQIVTAGGASPSIGGRELVALAAFTVVSVVVSWVRFRSILRFERYWGRL